MLDQPAEQAIFEGIEDIGHVGEITSRLLLGQVVVGRGGQGLGEVGGKDLRMEVLTNGFGQLAGELFDHEAVFEELERLLDAPAGVVELGEVLGGEGGGVGEGRGQDLDGAIGQEDFDEAQVYRLTEQFDAGGLGLAAHGGADGAGEDGFGPPRAQQGFPVGPLRAIQAGQPGDTALLEKSEQPQGRKPAVHDEQIVFS